MVSKKIPLRGVRGVIARKMMSSLQNSAQVSYFSEVDGRALLEAQSRWRSQGLAAGLEDLWIECLTRALRQHPDVNACASDVEAEVFEEVHCSVAIALGAGLVAPTIFNCQTKSLPEIEAARRDLVVRARQGSLTVPEMSSGTITISNLGASRVRHFTPILNGSQVAILGFGRMSPRPRISDGGVVVAVPVLPVSLTTDHRYVDGAPAAAFLTHFCDLVEKSPAMPVTHRESDASSQSL